MKARAFDLGLLPPSRHCVLDEAPPNFVNRVNICLAGLGYLLDKPHLPLGDRIPNLINAFTGIIHCGSEGGVVRVGGAPDEIEAGRDNNYDVDDGDR